MPNPEKMNLNYLLNKAYYDELPKTYIELSKGMDFSVYNNTLIEARFKRGEELVCFAEEKNKPFLLKTLYPGLLIGIGYTHDAGTKYDDKEKNKEKNAAEMKLGFTLDFVTGLPVIPGSSIKGVLRSAFKYHGAYVSGLVKDFGAVAVDVDALWKKVFGDTDDSGKVVFFDAIPIRAGKNDQLFGLDNITPHNKPFGDKDFEYNGLKNPIPLSMLKVIPNVVFLFRFGFDHWNDFFGVGEGLLQKVFKRILFDLGVGAKTNVGFGAMEELSSEDEAKLLKSPCYLEAFHTSDNVHALPQPTQAPPPARKPEGVCQWDGCHEKTHAKSADKGGGVQRYCQPHYMQTLGKRGKVQ